MEQFAFRGGLCTLNYMPKGLHLKLKRGKLLWQVHRKLLKKQKKGFKMPHLFWIMMGLLLITSLLTYIIPAGQFATDPETGKILGDQIVHYLGYQTPVSPIQMMLSMLEGLDIIHLSVGRLWYPVHP